jgi:hypothetical protein
MELVKLKKIPMTAGSQIASEKKMIAGNRNR